PVLLPTPAALGSWARLLGGNGRRTVRGAAAWVRPRHHAMPAPRTPAGAEHPRELLGAFRASASPGALDLAVHLAAVPLVLPVIQLVQEAMLPDTGPMELAEVLLSGLLERLPDIEDSPGPRYVFAPGVQDLLLHSLDQGAAVLVLKYLSEYVTRRFGKGTRNFPARAVARLSGRDPLEEGRSGGREPGGWRESVIDELFAEIPARVVSWYDPDVPVSGGLPEAERLLRRWWAQGDPRLLHQARTHAEAAVADALADLGRARLVLGRILHALTETGEVRRRPEQARELLHAAADQLTGDDLDTRFELAAVQHDLWQAEEDPEQLRAAVRTLRTMADESTAAGRPLTGRLEGKRRLWLGRVLLALAGADGRTGAARRVSEDAAAEAAVELRAAGDLLAVGGDDDPGLCAALLDLSAALRKAGADSAERLANLDRAEAAAGDNDTLRLRCARARARVHRDTGDPAAADLAYTAAEAHTERDSLERAELLTEWGTMLLDSAEGATHLEGATRAEGLLREALTSAPGGGPLAARLQLLLGRALVARFERESFLPDLYEGCHLLEQVARKGQEGELRAEAWLLLGAARQEFPAGHVPSGQAEQALTRSLTEARQTQGADASASVAAARALLARGRLHERDARHDAALADYSAAAAEWRQLTGRMAEGVPMAEVRETRERIAALEAEAE
ncbi:MAG: tetratricopeptide repeat protein, partial [Streptomyces sp.]